MGNYRFRLSDMIPNAWFYKLRDMNKTKTTNHHHKKPPSTTTPPPPHHHHHHQQQPPRTSFYYTPKVNQFHNSPTSKFPHFHHHQQQQHLDPPRNSSKRSKPHRKTIYKPSPKHTTESTQTLQDFFHSPSSESTHSALITAQSPSSESTQSELATASTTWCTSCRVSSSTSDIIIDIKNNTHFKKIQNPNGFQFSPENNLNLPPIITKPANPISRNRQTSLSGKKTGQTPARRSITGVKLRPNSPKIAISKKRNNSVQKKSSGEKNKLKTLSESFAIVKSSFDPEKDFMVSMMEMIVENNIRESKDLEDLLACYLSLNSNEYHHVIVKAFEQIWFTLQDL